MQRRGALSGGQIDLLNTSLHQLCTKQTLVDVISYVKQQIEYLLHCDAVNVILYDRGTIDTFHKEGGSSNTIKIEGHVMEIARGAHRNQTFDSFSPSRPPREKNMK